MTLRIIIIIIIIIIKNNACTEKLKKFFLRGVVYVETNLNGGLVLK